MGFLFEQNTISWVARSVFMCSLALLSLGSQGCSNSDQKGKSGLIESSSSSEESLAMMLTSEDADTVATALRRLGQMPPDEITPHATQLANLLGSSETVTYDHRPTNISYMSLNVLVRCDVGAIPALLECLNSSSPRQQGGALLALKRIVGMAVLESSEDRIEPNMVRQILEEMERLPPALHDDKRVVFIVTLLTHELSAQTPGQDTVQAVTLKKWTHGQGLLTVSTVSNSTEIVAVMKWMETHIPPNLDPDEIGAVMPECVLEIETATAHGTSTARSIDLYGAIDRSGTVAIEPQAFDSLFALFHAGRLE